MSKILEMREKRNKAWEAAKAFVETKRDKDGLLSEEDAKTYASMEQKVKDIGVEIDRMQAMEELENNLNMPVNTPLTHKPAGDKPEVNKTGRASEAYKTSLMTALCSNFKRIDNVLSEGVDVDGGYLVPEEYDSRLIEGLTEENIFRKLATRITTSGERKINIAGSKPAAAWIDEGEALTWGDTVVAGESLQVIFTSQNEQGTDFLMEYGQIVIEPPYDRKFLISDANGIFYTVVYDEELEEEILVEIEVEELIADVFREYGVDDMPQGDLLISLLNPVLHFWQDSENEIPSFGASLTALPPSQVVFSKNTLMNDSTILGIEKVDIEADDQTLFAFSFDGGDTWQAYINDMWVTLSEARSGMSRETVESIGTDAWNQATTDMQYMIRFVLFEGSYVTKITIHYLN